MAHGTGIGIGLFLLLIAANGVGLVIKNPLDGLPVALVDFTTFPVMIDVYKRQALQYGRRPASPSVTEIAARRRKGIQRNGAALRHIRCRKRARICQNPVSYTHLDIQSFVRATFHRI